MAKKKAPPKRKVGALGETPEQLAPHIVRTPVTDLSSPRPTKTTIEPPPIGEEDPEDVNFKYLRFSAGVYYTTDLQGVTVAQMSKHPIYSCVSRKTLDAWCTADKWVERRREVQQRWRRKIEDKVADELARTRIEQLKGLEKVYSKALKKLEDNLVEAKSWEGVATALVKVAQLMDDWREKIGGTVVSVIPDTRHSESGQSPLTGKMKSQLTEREARDMALMIMKKRREEMRASAEQPDEDDV